MPDPDSEGFLTRWSRLKRAGPEPAAQPSAEAPVKTPPAGAGEAAAAPAEPEAPVVRVEDLPKLEDLTPESDFAAFLQKGVPEELKRLALRRAWTLDPAIRDFVEVAENQYDWNAGNVPGFGELDPGFDMGKLLAQATGQSLPDDKSLVADARHIDADLPASPASPALQEEPADAGGEAAVADAPSAEEAGIPPEKEVPRLRERRRRHGGALPA